jgi:glycosyltransferase involved in cell wall biosynthesis
MPTYNRGWIIKRAIESILHQKFSDYEVIIVDDGSNDNTENVVSTFKDSRIRFEKIEHKGVTSARNRGVTLAKGDYISYLDTDNLWHPNFLEVMTKQLTNPYVLAYCDENMLLLDGKDLNANIIGRKVRNVDYNPVKLMQTNYIDINSVIHTKTLFKTIGLFDEKLTAYEDWDFFARTAIKYPFQVKHVDQVLCDYFYFLSNAAPTITNQVISDKNLLAFFQKKEPVENEKIIVDKINRLIDEYYPKNEES